MRWRLSTNDGVTILHNANAWINAVDRRFETGSDYEANLLALWNVHKNDFLQHIYPALNDSGAWLAVVSTVYWSLTLWRRDKDSEARPRRQNETKIVKWARVLSIFSRAELLLNYEIVDVKHELWTRSEFPVRIGRQMYQSRNQVSVAKCNASIHLNDYYEKEIKKVCIISNLEYTWNKYPRDPSWHNVYCSSALCTGDGNGSNYCSQPPS